MHTNRFDFALERLGPSDWEKFERLASQFLVSEFPTLRTLATPSGDGGRDAVLFSPSDDESVVLQYSVTPSWEQKIRRTMQRLQEQNLDISLLIYATNQEIGAKADTLKKSVRQQYRIVLDIRDKNWFIDRVNLNNQNQEAAETLATSVVDTYLATKHIISGKANALNETEARAAFVFLALQWEDETREKGLTKLSFEALVRSVLRDTDADHRLTRVEIYSRIQQLFPNHSTEELQRNTDTALRALTKRYVRHYASIDEFCLTHEERTRVINRLTDIERNDKDLTTELKGIVERVFGSTAKGINELTSRTRRILESFLLSRGELFASTVISGEYKLTGSDSINDFVIRDVAEHQLTRAEKSYTVDMYTRTVKDALTNPGISLREHLRSLADAYTLLAFLRSTPDVQAAVGKMFAHGDVWVDANILLPAFAETLFPVEQQRFTSMIRAANEAGIHLFITPGVLEEIERHINLSLSCAQNKARRWEGHVPFLYSVFIQTGRATSSFSKWTETFRGSVRPEDDIAEYLLENFNIQRQSLEDEVRAAPMDLRVAIQEAWQSEHERRRLRQRRGSDSLLAMRLASHDIENFLGVIYRRRNETTSSLGYNSWWLTLDRAAYDIEKKVRYANKTGSPLMTPDFLLNYLALGPIRMQVSKQTEKMLPIALDIRATEVLSPDFVDIANQVREKYKDLPENIIRRRVRDELDAAKSRPGKITVGGLQALEEELLGTAADA